MKYLRAVFASKTFSVNLLTHITFSVILRLTIYYSKRNNTSEYQKEDINGKE